jgi:UDP-N-acetylglucosamine diphosphorylase/glucosamine-1-phosphate N-acetyltransferase
MRALYLLDPDPAPAWAPFAGARPLSELRAGAHLVRERWERFAGVTAREIFSLPHLEGFAEPGMPPVAVRHPVQGPALIGSSTFAPTAIAQTLPDGAFRLTAAGVTVGWGVGPGATWSGPQPGVAAVEIAGCVLHGTYDLVRALDALLGDDVHRMLGDSDPIPRGSTVLGDAGALAIHGADVEPGVLFDTRGGAIALEEGVEVRAGTRLEGPLWIGPHTRVRGGEVRAAAIGPYCVVHGELASTVFLGYANKSHDGFVGHSVIGRWANLGAGTITSNLKNTYGPVRLEVAGSPFETGLMNLGSLIGDHAKTAIGTLLSTGTVVGTAAQVFDDVRPPKYVPPFAWGGAGANRMTRDGFLTVAGRVLQRRKVAFDAPTRNALSRIYDWATAPGQP